MTTDMILLFIVCTLAGEGMTRLWLESILFAPTRMWLEDKQAAYASKSERTEETRCSVANGNCVRAAICEEMGNGSCESLPTWWDRTMAHLLQGTTCRECTAFWFTLAAFLYATGAEILLSLLLTFAAVQSVYLCISAVKAVRNPSLPDFSVEAYFTRRNQ